MITAERRDEFAEHYGRALRDHLTIEDPEDSLAAAYKLGREAVDTGLGVLELTSIHQQAMHDILGKTPRNGARLSDRANGFISESLAPFEMMLSGFREANASLRKANEALEGYAAQLAVANDALEHERATLAGLSGMSDGVVLIGAGGKIRYCNARAGELLGVVADDVAGETVEALTAPAGGLPADFGRWLDEQGERSTFEIEDVGPPPRDLVVQVFPVANSDADERGLVIHDVSAERRLARAKDELASIVSHELRSPLTVILGYADLLNRHVMDDEARGFALETIYSEARRVTELIDDFLDVQRIELGHMRLSREPTSLSGLVDRAVAALPHDVALPFVTDVPSTLPDVSVDPKRALQVLVNLLSNAHKYSPDGGEVRVSARALDEAVEICVSDQGLGLTPDVLPQLFEKFFRVDDPERWAIRGTGLGLAICREIVEAHGGRIWAESDGPGRGSRFYFTLPKADV
jgi:signal transduction histidine kinase